MKTTTTPVLSSRCEAWKERWNRVRGDLLNPWRWSLAFVLAGVPFVSAQEWGTTDRFETLSAEARQLETDGQYAQAAERYRTILQEFPNSAEASFRIGYCEGRAGNIDAAIAAYQATIESDPSGYWTEPSLYYKARDCVEFGRTIEARNAIATLKTIHPDSVCMVKALVLEARLDGLPTANAESAVDLELQAVAMLDEALTLVKQNRDGEALALLDDLMAQYPNQATALRALESVGHIHLRSGQDIEAEAAFAEILDRVGDKAPSSRIVLTARTRLAAIRHRQWDLLATAELYTRVIQAAENTPFLANAVLQLAGVRFEILQRAILRGEVVTDAQWDEVRDLCREHMALDIASGYGNARAHLMIVESLVWQRRPDAEVIAEADRFLAEHNDPARRQEIATVRLLLGESLLRLGRNEEALEQFAWIVNAYHVTEEIWPGMDHLSRAYLRWWQALRRTGAPREQVEAAREAILTYFPDSGSAGFIRLDMQDPSLEGN